MSAQGEGRVAQLGYLAFGVKDLGAWEAFTTGVLGLQLVGPSSGNGFVLRHDSRAARFFVTPGHDDVTCIGWEVPGEAALEATARRLKDSGFEAKEAPKGHAATRRMGHVLTVMDPSGIPTEIACGPEMAEEDFSSDLVTSGFVADELGLGHVVVSSLESEASQRFYAEGLGFRFSDRITTEIYGHHVDIAFFHANARHHSLAFGGPQPKRIHHFMLEVGALDDVGLCYDRALRAGVPISQTLGRHPNDRMLSFYAHTPSGFQFEFGWGGREVHDGDWEPTTYDHISEWGHHPPHVFAPRKPH